MEKNCVRVVSCSPAMTEDIGSRLGRMLVPGDLVCLSGDLGAGKTCLVRGIARELGADPKDVSSPTFVLAQEYRGRVPLYHMDLYRLTSSDEVEDAGLDEYLAGNGIAIIEWPGIYPRLAQMDRIEVNIALDCDEPTRRTLTICAYGPRHERKLEVFRKC